MKKTLPLLALLAGCGGPSPAAPTPAAPAAPGATAPGGPSLASLDGTAWKVTVEPAAEGEKPFPDVLRFEEQHVGSAAQKDLAGFNPDSYSAQTPENGPITFEGTLKNDKGESFTISGKATVDRLWGTMTWRRADWTLRTYRFQGGRKPPRG